MTAPPSPAVCPEFDIQDFSDWWKSQCEEIGLDFELCGSYERDGVTYYPMISCPIAERTHGGTDQVTVFTMGKTFGFHCLNPECEAWCAQFGSGLGGFFAKMRDLGLEPYPGEIFVDSDTISIEDVGKPRPEHNTPDTCGPATGITPLNADLLPGAPAEQGNDPEVADSNCVANADLGWGKCGSKAVVRGWSGTPEFLCAKHADYWRHLMGDPEEDDATDLEEPSAAVEIKPSVQDELSFPEECLYGWLGDAARRLNTPPGYAYPAMLAVFSPTSKTGSGRLRRNLYVALVGPPHSGKGETMDRAIELMCLPPGMVSTTTPGSDKGVLREFGGDANSGKASLLHEDELSRLMSKIQVKGSSLAAILCTLFYKDETGAADKGGKASMNAQLSILGGLAVDKDGGKFEQYFGAETTAGLFDRFIFGIATDRWQWQAPRYVPERSQARFPMGCTVPEWAQEHARNWAATDPKRDRLQEIALRVALLSASANHESVVSQQCLAAAIKFVEWQERVRRR
jgi:hypothetical protein